jgi:hypothetical protein
MSSSVENVIEYLSLLFVNFSFCPSIGESSTNSSVRELSNPSSVGEQNIFLAIRKLDCLDP